MSVEQFKTVIEKKIFDSGVNEVAIVLNSKYVTHSGKLVYVGVSSEKKEESSEYSIICYYKEKDAEDHWRKQEITKSIMSKLFTAVTSPNFYGFQAPAYAMSFEDSVVKVDPALGFLIIESPLYALGRQLMSEQDSANLHTILHDIHFDNAALKELKAVFRMESFNSYQNLIYNKIQNRIIQKIYKRNSFYNIQKTFVPVFIAVKNIYNPFSDDVSSEGYKNTTLYQMAVDKDRKVEVGNISCYMLTHLEICKAFGLSKFMRFTPDFVYKVFVGLLHPEYVDFPNKFNKVFVAPDVEELPGNLKKKYTENEYNNCVLQLGAIMKDSAESEGSDEKYQTAHKEIKILQAYSEIDSLRAACIQSRKALTTIGPSILDGSISERALYTIISEAHI